MNTPLLASLGMGGAELLIIAAVLGAIGFWIWMLIDCVTKETDQNQKIVWVIILAVIGFIGARLYLFIRKIPRRSARR